MSPGTTAAPAVLPRAAGENLEAHNQARAVVGVGPLKWSKQPQGTKVTMVYWFASMTNHKYGANQLWGSRATTSHGG
ncbi:hypothetical protein Gohar_018198 [Gossypium harknessii]|uniref:SCP domain-containing protein n=1 Tax=Gossypium harknessii TaxID=34285 RepID=A0A7J9GAH6_9ROSI|nr:hypothetical protein [Gossypium harknessii]